MYTRVYTYIYIYYMGHQHLFLVCFILIVKLYTYSIYDSTVVPIPLKILFGVWVAKLVARLLIMAS